MQPIVISEIFLSTFLFGLIVGYLSLSPAPQFPGFLFIFHLTTPLLCFSPPDLLPLPGCPVTPWTPKNTSTPPPPDWWREPLRSLSSFRAPSARNASDPPTGNREPNMMHQSHDCDFEEGKLIEGVGQPPFPSQ